MSGKEGLIITSTNGVELIDRSETLIPDLFYEQKVFEWLSLQNPDLVVLGPGLSEKVLDLTGELNGQKRPDGLLFLINEPNTWNLTAFIECKSGNRLRKGIKSKIKGFEEVSQILREHPESLVNAIENSKLCETLNISPPQTIIIPNDNDIELIFVGKKNGVTRKNPEHSPFQLTFLKY